MASAFNAAAPGVGGWIVAVCAFLFGYTTLIGWGYYGEQFLEYIFGARVRRPYRWLYCLLIPIGAVMKPDVVWAWGDLMNAFQVFPNVIGLVGLSALAARYAWAPVSRRDAGRPGRKFFFSLSPSPLDRLRGGWYDPRLGHTAGVHGRQRPLSRAGVVTHARGP